MQHCMSTASYEYTVWCSAACQTLQLWINHQRSPIVPGLHYSSQSWIGVYIRPLWIRHWVLYILVAITPAGHDTTSWLSLKLIPKIYWKPLEAARGCLLRDYCTSFHGCQMLEWVVRSYLLDVMSLLFTIAFDWEPSFHNLVTFFLASVLRHFGF